MEWSPESLGWIGIGGADAPLPDPARFGTKAAWLASAARAGLPVPPGFVLPPEAMADANSAARALDIGLARLAGETGRSLDDAERPLLVALRPSPAGDAGNGAGGGGITPALLNLGVTAGTLPALSRDHGARLAQDLDRRLVQAYGSIVLGLDAEEFEFALHDALKAEGLDSETDLPAGKLAELAAGARALLAEEGLRLPCTARAQLEGGLAAMAASWSSPRAMARRAAKGCAGDVPLAFIVQAMVLGLGDGEALSGAGIAAPRSEKTGELRLTGRFLADAQGEEAVMGMRTPALLTVAERLEQGIRTRALEERAPDVVEALAEAARRIETALGDAFAMDFTVERGRLWITELRPLRRTARAAVRIVVELADAGAIAREEALMRIDPQALEEHLHPSIDTEAPRDLIGQGLPASPGAASGPLVFSPDAAEAAAAEGRPAILALIETSPEDIRGMHAARGVLTVRGGMTSHAAVVARGLGTPCVVGARSLRLKRAGSELSAPDGRVFRAGDVITVDGGTGQVIAGAVKTRAPEITGAFARLMAWADDARRMGVRANADTGQDARVASGFEAEGIGLCRTEHMFFQRGRIAAMRRMILANSAEDRHAALAELKPMQQADFQTLFEAMAGRPVVIRLLDPPLHEFLPHGDEEIAELATALGVAPEEVRARAQDLAEFNPMLGNRGCRIGIAYPEIYEMQAQAIFEAACDAARATGQAVVPEIMIPLVSAVRELELLKARIDAVAGRVHTARNEMVAYHVGVMIETPRACLRAADIARAAEFISFGTNDLTQMVYGLSRDDAGRFMPGYVSQGVFEHDPFHSLDRDGVGEMVSIAAERARAAAPGFSLGLCGEHGADPRSVAFCEEVGLDYVSCSPFRVPIARLAAAQAAIARRRAGSGS